MKQPTNLQRLEELISWAKVDVREELEPRVHERLAEELAWLEWAYDTLNERNLYHKKQSIKKAMMVKLATSLLSKDELAEVDKQAEEALNAHVIDPGGSIDDDTRIALDRKQFVASEEDSEAEID